MVTWGLTGRGSEKTATAYCEKCREILESGIVISEARHVTAGFELMHRCKTANNKAP